MNHHSHYFIETIIRNQSTFSLKTLSEQEIRIVYIELRDAERGTKKYKSRIYTSDRPPIPGALSQGSQGWALSCIICLIKR